MTFKIDDIVEHCNRPGKFIIIGMERCKRTCFGKCNTFFKAIDTELSSRNYDLCPHLCIKIGGENGT
jgi:hypothetical protein